MQANASDPHRRATIKDVARVAGVSLGTVSHVLNGKKRVSSAASAAVLAAVAELGYRPNGLARSLIARRPDRRAGRKTDGPRLISVGYLSIDYMVAVDAVPEPGIRTTSRGIEKMLGGPAANVAAFAAGLGPPFEVEVQVVSRVGTDADSDWALEELALRGIDVSGTFRARGGRLSRCIVLVDAGGQRTIVNEPLQVPVDLVLRHLQQDARPDRRTHLHFDGFHLPSDAALLCDLRQAGFGLSMHSAGLPPERATLSGCAWLMRHFDVVMLDREAFAGVAKGDLALTARPEVLFDRVPGTPCQAVILTQGAGGALLLRPGRTAVRQSARQTDVVDATGAGDALAGIFLAAWLSHGDAQAALALAVRGASLSLTALGAQGHLPRAEALDPTVAPRQEEARA